VAGSCVHEPSNSIKDEEFVDRLGDYHVPMKYSA
jgi:hypothetical protein